MRPRPVVCPMFIKVETEAAGLGLADKPKREKQGESVGRRT